MALGKGSELFLGRKGQPIALEDKIGKLTSIGEMGAEAEEYETTDLDSGGYREFEQSFKDSGSIDITGKLVEGDDGFTRLKELFDSGDVVPFGVAHPTVEQANLGGNCYVANYKVGERTPDGQLLWTATLRVSGALTDFTKPTE